MNLANHKPDAQIRCPQCNKIPGASIKTGKAFMTHICHENCGNVYWTLQQCPGCQHPEATILVQKPRYSQLIMCKACKMEFYLFLCPVNQCKSLFFKTKDSYIMGVPLSCQGCKHFYKQVVCQCGYEVILENDAKICEGQPTLQCKMCEKQIIYTICTFCFKTNYHADNLQLGQRFKCNHCKESKQYIPCPKCGRTTKHNHFSYCKFYECQFCCTGFEYSSCPFCSMPNYHFTQKALGPARSCSNNQCKSTYFVMSCLKCQESVYFEQFDSNQGRQEDCPKCKAILKFYYCKACKKFNPVDSKCFNPKCPPPATIKSYSKQAQKANKKKQLDNQKQQTKKMNENYEAKQCKICYSNDSCMVNNTCGHVMMCQICFKQYQKKGNHLTNNASCPVCKKIGPYTKVIEYIYQ